MAADRSLLPWRWPSCRLAIDSERSSAIEGVGDLRIRLVMNIDEAEVIVLAIEFPAVRRLRRNIETNRRRRRTAAAPGHEACSTRPAARSCCVHNSGKPPTAFLLPLRFSLAAM